MVKCNVTRCFPWLWFVWDHECHHLFIEIPKSILEHHSFHFMKDSLVELFEYESYDIFPKRNPKGYRNIAFVFLKIWNIDTILKNLKMYSKESCLVYEMLCNNRYIKRWKWRDDWYREDKVLIMTLMRWWKWSEYTCCFPWTYGRKILLDILVNGHTHFIIILVA